MLCKHLDGTNGADIDGNTGIWCCAPPEVVPPHAEPPAPDIGRACRLCLYCNNGTAASPDGSSDAPHVLEFRAIPILSMAAL